MKEFQLVMLEKYEFENGDLSVLIPFLAFWACQDSRAEMKEDDLF